MITASQFIERIQLEAKEIEAKLDRRQGTPELIKRLKDINTMLENIQKVSK